eukprot:jgi/Galph1/890/GphlegSOOS_G5717.1
MATESCELYVYLRNVVRSRLAEALSVLPGPKILIFESAFYDQSNRLPRILEMWTDTAFLKEYGVCKVEKLKDFLERLRRVPEESFSEVIQQLEARQLVFFVRSISTSFLLFFIAESGKSLTTLTYALTDINSQDKFSRPEDYFRYHCVLIPRKSPVFEFCLEELKVTSHVEFSELPLGFFAIEQDLLTLDQPSSFRDISIDGDNNSILHIAQALVELEDIIGPFNHIRGIGKHSKKLSRYFMRYHNEKRTKTPRPRGRGSYIPNAVKSHEEKCLSMIILDRTIDLITPLLTQWTFAGLLDEAFGLSNTTFVWDSSLSKEKTVGAETTGERWNWLSPQTLKQVSPKDFVFDQLKDHNFSIATDRLSSMASSVREMYRAKPNPENSEISEVKNFVKNLANLKAEQEAISFHTELASEISKRTFESHSFKQRYQMERRLLESNADRSHLYYLLGCIARQEPLENVLRLVCLWSMTNDGIEGDSYDFLMREILSSYGVETATLLHNLEFAELLVRAKDPAIFSALGKRFSSPKVPSWAVCRTTLRLLTDYQPQDSGSAEIEETGAFSGYIPLTAKIVQSSLKDSAWKKFLSTCSGFLKGIQTAFEEDLSVDTGDRSGKRNSEERFDAVVVIIGGLSRAEAASIRAVSRRMGKQVLIVSTAVMNGNLFIQSLVDETEKWPF